MSIKIDAKAFIKKATNIRKDVKVGLTAYGRVAAAKMESEAKQNKPWTNRTGDAVKSIKGSSGFEGNDLVIAISGGMPYSPELELAREKKYAILYPTLQQNKNDLIKGAAAAVGKEIKK